MTFEEWYKVHWKECKSGTFELHTTYQMIWNAAIKAASDYVGYHPYGGMEPAEDLLKDLTS